MTRPRTISELAEEGMRPFRPSEVFLNTVPPLTGTMGKSEIEHAASILVRVCQVRGDTWAPVLPKEMGEVIKADLDAGVEPWKSLNRNPFFRPDFWMLVDKGFGRWLGEPGKSAIELTATGIEALRARWVRAPDDPSAVDEEVRGSR